MRLTHKSLLAFLLFPLVVATVVFAALLWPSHHKYAAAENLGSNVKLVNATAVTVVNGSCPGDPSANICQTVRFHITSGPDKGTDTTLNNPEGPGQATLHAKDEVVLGHSADTTDGTGAYYFSDFQRKVPMVWLTLIFAVLVVAIARWRGVGALIGLIFTWLAISYFIIPSLLAGHSPVLVSIVGSAAIVIVVLYVAHGFNARTTVALVGTLLSLILTGLIAWLSVKATYLTGLSSDEATYVQLFANQVKLQGLVLGGIIIGSLGVLNDMTVTQSSTVWEIHLADPSRSRVDVYRSAIRVGRDHIASTVYTLVLAYAGAALPLLILFSVASRPFGDVIGTDVVGEEVVRALVGSIGLMLSVPLTTALAAIVLRHGHETAMTTEPEVENVEAYEEALNNPSSEGESVEADKYDALVAKPKEPTKKRRLFRKKNETFERKMTRREKKFWEEEK